MLDGLLFLLYAFIAAGGGIVGIGTDSTDLPSRIGCSERLLNAGEINTLKLS
jgi:hypothetical protein